MPTFSVSLLVLQCKREYGVPFLHSVFPLGVVGLERAVDGVKGRRGWERVLI